jgi:hypothetical protein
MAISVGEHTDSIKFTLFLILDSAVLVGETQNWIPELKQRATALQVNAGFENGADLYV